MSDRDWTDADLESSLRRAFVDHGADYIIINDRRNRFLWEGAALGVNRGWLTEEFKDFPTEQYSEMRYRLTKKGRRHFGFDDV